ncbi:MAG: TlpA disulfide reductase family protein [Lacunisphaera sp.]
MNPRLRQVLTRVALALALFASAAAAESARPDFEDVFGELLSRLHDPDPAHTPDLTAAAIRLLLDYPERRSAEVPLSSLVGVGGAPGGDAAARARRKYAREELARYLEMDSVPPAAFEKMANLDFLLGSPPPSHPAPSDPEPDLDHLQAALVRLEQRLPRAASLPMLEEWYLDTLVAKRPAEVEPRLRMLAASANPEVAAIGQGRLSLRAAEEHPFEMAFTALDGRPVDVARLRGKVVLVDFWATWCGPCIAELPNIKAVYEKYHDRGFEVVSVSLDGAADKAKLVDFLAEQKIPWPQHFDGRGWKNEFAAKYAINAVPAMFLLDPDGRIVSTNARGEALEREVKKLLKL